MKIDPDKLPKHIAIIMDGNGRWAKRQGVPKIMGHTEGVKTVENIITACKDMGIKILTVYAFSTENWKRHKTEVDFLMTLLKVKLSEKAEKLNKQGVKVNVIGDIKGLPVSVQEKIKYIMDLTKDNDVLLWNVALNYGSREEIVEAAKSLFKDIQTGKCNIDTLNEDIFSSYLYTKGMPDPDLLIRTSGEMRLSNFLLWQISYAELYITQKFWPEFTSADLEEAILAYQNRDRRFGGR